VQIAFHSVSLSSDLEDGGRHQWVHLLPKGRFAGRDGRGPWLATNLDQVIRNTQDYAGKTLLAVDYDHQIDKSGQNGQPAPAAGWIVNLEARDDGLWGLVEWTAKAAAHIRAKEYRYLSPVFNYSPGTNEVKRLLRAGLTNSPALELTALASTQENPSMSEDTLARLRELLGLKETDGEEAIIQAVSELVTAQQSTQPDPMAYVPMEEFKTIVAELQEMRTRQTSETEAQMMVDRAIDKGHIPPSMERWGVEVCMSNKQAFENFIHEVSPVFRALRGHQTQGWKESGNKGRRHGLSEEQLSICETMGISPEDYAKQLEKAR
jgi:phage I-like protein